MTGLRKELEAAKAEIASLRSGGAPAVGVEHMAVTKDLVMGHDMDVEILRGRVRHSEDKVSDHAIDRVVEG